MNLTLACNARLPSERAHPLQVVRMWEAFNELDETEATLLYPFRFQREKPLRPYGRQFWTWYGMTEPCGPNVRLPTLDAVHILDLIPSLVKFYSRVQQTSFALSLATWLRLKGRGYPLWSREILSLPVLRWLCPSLPVFYEMHRFPGSHIDRQLKWLQHARGVICISEGLKRKLVESGYPDERILVAPDGYVAEEFDSLPDRAEAQTQLKFSVGSHVVYTGHLYAWKGIDTVIQGLAGLPNLTLHVVGGMTEDIQSLRDRFSPWPNNVILHGHQPPQDIPLWLRAADLIVVPNSAQSTISRDYTSPLKLFEALASGTPVVVSDLPSLREIVDESVATIVSPDDPQVWCEAVQNKIDDPQQQAQSERAREHVTQYTWKNRAAHIRQFISKTL